jgi:hypothetical protein
MPRRLFNVASFVSAVLAGGTLVLSLAMFVSSPWNHRVSLTNRFHVGVWSGFGGDTLGRLVIFNDDQYGPYRGSVVQIGDGKGNAYPRFDRELARGDSFGIYYRYFRESNGTTLWTLMVSLWYPLILFALLSAAWVVRKRRSPVNSRPIHS